MSHSNSAILSAPTQHGMHDALPVLLKSQFTLQIVEQMPSTEIHSLIHRLIDLTDQSRGLPYDIRSLCPSVFDLLSSGNHSTDNARGFPDLDHHSDNIPEREVRKTIAADESQMSINIPDEGDGSKASVQEPHRLSFTEKDVETFSQVNDKPENMNKILLTKVPTICASCQQPFRPAQTSGVESRRLSKAPSRYYTCQGIKQPDLGFRDDISFDEIFGNLPYNKVNSGPGPDIFMIQLRPARKNHRYHHDIEELDDVCVHLDTYNDRNIVSEKLASTLRNAALLREEYPTTPIFWGKQKLTCLRVLTVAFFTVGLTGVRRPLILQMQVVPDKEMPLNGLIVSKKEIALHGLLQFVEYDLTMGNLDRSS